MRICFFGTPAAAVPALGAFLGDADTEVVAVVTNPDRPSGRGHTLTPPPVKVTAAAAGVPVWQPGKPREVSDRLRALRLDACAVVAYGALLPPDVLAAGGRGVVNLHFSLLPAWRGAAPVQHTLLAGDRETGVSCIVLDEGMDTGPILLSERTPVRDDETAGNLLDRLATLGAPLLVRSVTGLVDGSLVAQPQDSGAATYAPKVTPADARLDWRAPAEHLERAVRAFNPVPGAWTSLRGERLKVHAAAVTAAGDQPPGAIFGSGNAPAVACGRQALRLIEVQPAGKPRMSATDFVNGYRPLGERLL